MNWIAEAFRSPSAFYSSPWKFARNQIGHAYILGGFIGVWVPQLLQIGPVYSPLWCAVCVALYGIWEGAQWKTQGAALSDCLEDMAHFLFGTAVAIVAMLVGYGNVATLTPYLQLLIIIHLILIGAGIAWRYENKGAAV